MNKYNVAEFIFQKKVIKNTDGYKKAPINGAIYCVFKKILWKFITSNCRLLTYIGIFPSPAEFAFLFLFQAHG